MGDIPTIQATDERPPITADDRAIVRTVLVSDLPSIERAIASHHLGLELLHESCRSFNIATAQRAQTEDSDG